MTAGMEESARKRLCAQIPMARPGLPGEVARVARFLADDACYVTGQVWTVDGGLS
jgi:NAD(P)-dependent dehydrogenase (short-subunit alcohol dehydrogenase family)